MKWLAWWLPGGWWLLYTVSPFIFLYGSLLNTTCDSFFNVYATNFKEQWWFKSHIHLNVSITAHSHQKHLISVPTNLWQEEILKSLDSGPVCQTVCPGTLVLSTELGLLCLRAKFLWRYNFADHVALTWVCL